MFAELDVQEIIFAGMNLSNCTNFKAMFSGCRRLQKAIFGDSKDLEGVCFGRSSTIFLSSDINLRDCTVPKSSIPLKALSPSATGFPSI